MGLGRQDEGGGGRMIIRMGCKTGEGGLAEEEPAGTVCDAHHVVGWL